MGRKAGCRFHISIINEGTNNKFVPLTVNLPEHYHCQQGKNPAKHFIFISQVTIVLFLENILPQPISVCGNPKLLKVRIFHS